MIDINTIEQFFNYFYQHRYRVSRKLIKSKTTQKHCDSFLKIIDKKYTLESVGTQFLWEYFLFQFNYWHDLTFENSFSGDVQLAWVIGKKAFQRWDERNREYDWQIDTYPIVKAY